MLYIAEPVKMGGWMHIKTEAPEGLKAQAEIDMASFLEQLNELIIARVGGDMLRAAWGTDES